MKLYEVLEEAKQKGYTSVNDGASTWDLATFTKEHRDTEGDYTLDYSGNVIRYKDDGYQESTSTFTCGNETVK